MKIRGGTRIAILLLCVQALRGAALPLWASQPEDKAKAQEKQTEKPILPASLAGFSDSGTFYLYKNEERLMTITFTWKADGSFKNDSTLSFAGQTVKQSLTISPDKEGSWTAIKHKCRPEGMSISCARAALPRKRQREKPSRST